MSSYGPPGPNQPEDPYDRPTSVPPGGSSTPEETTAYLPPMPSDQPETAPLPPMPSDQPETAPLPPRPPAGPYPPSAGPYAQPSSGGSYPPPASPYASPPPPASPYAQPSSGGSYPPPPPPSASPYAQPGAGPQWNPPGNAVPGPPQYGAPGPYGPGPGTPYGPPPGPPKRNGLKIGLIIGAVVLLLLCACGVLAVWGLSRVDTDSDGNASDIPTTRPTFSGIEPSLEPEFVAGDCLVNDGTDSRPELRKVPCGPGTLEVALKIPFSTDGSACETLAPGSDVEYTYDGPSTASDYVLCLRER